MKNEKECREALLPCPFCGGEAASSCDYVDGHLYEVWTVLCTGCGVTTPGYDNEKEAFDVWQSRARIPEAGVDEAELARSVARYFAGHSYNDDEYKQCLGLVQSVLRPHLHPTQREECEALREKYRKLVAAFDKHVGTPCEQIRHANELEKMREEWERFIEASQEMANIAKYYIFNYAEGKADEEVAKRYDEALAICERNSKG